MATVDVLACDYIASDQALAGAVQASVQDVVQVVDLAEQEVTTKLVDAGKVSESLAGSTSATWLKNVSGTADFYSAFSVELAQAASSTRAIERLTIESLETVQSLTKSAQTLTVQVQSQVQVSLQNQTRASESLTVGSIQASVTDTVFGAERAYPEFFGTLRSGASIKEAADASVEIRVRSLARSSQATIPQPSPRLVSRAYVLDKLSPSGQRTVSAADLVQARDTATASAVPAVATLSSTVTSFQFTMVVSGFGYLAAITQDKETGEYDLAHGLHTLAPANWADAGVTSEYRVGEGDPLPTKFQLGKVDSKSDRKVALEALWLTGPGMSSTIISDGAHDRKPRVRDGRGRYQFGLGAFRNEWSLVASGFDKIESATLRVRNSKLRY